MQTTDQDLLPESAVQMTEQDLFGAIQTLIAQAGGRAGERRADDRAGSPRHCIAEAAPEGAMPMTK